jgi:hypothetical protein
MYRFSFPFKMYLETLQSVCLFYERADPATRAQELERECWKCCVSRDPRILTLGGHWLHRCVVGFLPASFAISKDLYDSHQDLWKYLSAEFGKEMKVEEEVDVGTSASQIRPGGFLLTSNDFEDPEWMHMVSAGNLHLWRKRFLLPWP